MGDDAPSMTPRFDMSAAKKFGIETEGRKTSEVMEDLYKKLEELNKPAAGGDAAAAPAEEKKEEAPAEEKKEEAKPEQSEEEKAKKKAQIEAMRKLFAETDKNGDGTITKDELVALYAKAGVDINDPQAIEFMDAQFKKLDKDGNGNVSLEEYFKEAGLSEE